MYVISSESEINNNKVKKKTTRKQFFFFFFFYFKLPLTLRVPTVYGKFHFEMQNIEDFSNVWQARTYVCIRFQFSSLNNQWRICTIEYKVTFLVIGCSNNPYYNCTCCLMIIRYFCVVIMWIIYSRFWFGAQCTWIMDAYIRPWWLKCKFLMSSWLRYFTKYTYVLYCSRV